MLTYYNLLLECKGYEAAREVADYFNQNKPTLENNKTIDTETQLVRRGDGYWLVGVSFEGLVAHPNHRPSYLQEAVSEIFSLLSVAPSYSAAAFGEDAIDSFSQMAIEEIILQNANFGYLFLTDMAWERLGQPKGFEPFADGYYWNPN